MSKTTNQLEKGCDAPEAPHMIQAECCRCGRSFPIEEMWHCAYCGTWSCDECVPLTLTEDENKPLWKSNN